ncbi:MAG: hypothetical protein R3185_00360, partial [Candidatus Thermoplasmatota archaeon]|nr:hypothetical protein [Candidatus Thermoplasmatota archaeon]
MSPRTLQALLLLVALGAAVLANPPPGHLFGIEISILLWGIMLLAAVIGAVLALTLTGTVWAYLGLAFVALPLLGPIHAFGETGFIAILVGAWAMALLIELATYATRKARWSKMLEGSEDALTTYERAYTRSFRNLAGVTGAGLALVAGLYWLLIRLAPGSFSRSLEGQHPEGMTAFLLLTIGFIAAIALITRSEPE